MKVSQLANHIMQTFQRREPVMVGKAVIRSYYIDTFDALGYERSELCFRTTDELSELWNSTLAPREYNPTPTPYAIGACYAFFMSGIADYGAIKFKATSKDFLGFGLDGQIVYSPKSGRILHNYSDYIPAIYFIFIADEVIHPYILEFQWNGDSATITFALSIDDIRKFQETISQLRKQN